MHLRLVKKEKRGSFQVFCNEANKAIGIISQNSYQNHFRGSSKKLPHFSMELNSRIKSLVEKDQADKLREIIEKVGLQIVAEKMSGLSIIDVQIMSMKEIIALLTAVNKSQDETEKIKIKKVELLDKNKRFDEALNAALYGGELPKMKDAEIIKDNVTTRGVQRVDGPTKTKLLRESTEGA